MADTVVEALILDLLECGLVIREDVNGRCVVKITSSGRDLLVQRDTGKQHE